MVERVVWDHEAAGSKPVTRTIGRVFIPYLCYEHAASISSLLETAPWFFSGKQNSCYAFVKNVISGQMKRKVFFDSDSFFYPSDIGEDYMREQRKWISIERENQDLFELFEQYYLGFRTSMIICENENDTEDALKLLKEWCETCLLMAKDYVIKHINSDASLPVDYLWIAKLAIIDAVKDDYPIIETIPIKLSMKPTISARVKDKNTIVFPALIRAVLNQCNLVLINFALSTIEHKHIQIDRQFLSRFILPYLLFCHDDLSVRNLPIVGAYSEEAVNTALSYTNLQVIYIFAHEYAHILLKHFDDNSASKTSETKENEADAFAINAVVEYISRDNNYTKEDVFTAIRWLYKFQLLEERVGILARGETIREVPSEFEKRRSLFQREIIRRCNITGTTLLDQVGFVGIVSLQDVLNEYGSPLIEAIFQAFNNSKRTGEVEPWWKMIDPK